VHLTGTPWTHDSELGAEFVAQTLRFEPDYDGEVTATLVRCDPLLAAARGAVLYLHGFIDYFFQAHVARAFRERGHEFYALDLRKYGRSWRDRHPNFCKRFSEYYAEISAALDVMAGEGHAASIALVAHSTGAVSGCLYAKEGAHRERISRIVLNSPFLGCHVPCPKLRAGAFLGRFAPFAPREDVVNPWYGKSLHKSAKGEWEFNTRLKPLEGFVARFGWFTAVVREHDRIAGGLGLQQPILVLHSDTSCTGTEWREEFHRGDLVLNVEDIKALSPRLGSCVELREIRGAKHDVLLSQPDVLPIALDAIFDWLAR
jgi:alpha-beta hydrolase superfamily lysophospholipase